MFSGPQNAGQSLLCYHTKGCKDILHPSKGFFLGTMMPPSLIIGGVLSSLWGFITFGGNTLSTCESEQQHPMVGLC